MTVQNDIRSLWDQASRLRVDLEMSGLANRDLAPEPLWCRLEGLAETTEEYERWKEAGNSAPPWVLKALGDPAYRELLKLRRKMASLDEAVDDDELSDMSLLVSRLAIAGILEDLFLRPEKISAEKKLKMLKDVQSFVKAPDTPEEEAATEDEGLAPSTTDPAEDAMDAANIPERYREAMREVFERQQVATLKERGISIIREETRKLRAAGN